MARHLLRLRCSDPRSWLMRAHCQTSGVSLTVIDKITSAGVVQYSPANTAAELTDAYIAAVEAARTLNAYVHETPDRARAKP